MHSSPPVLRQYHRKQPIDGKLPFGKIPPQIHSLQSARHPPLFLFLIVQVAFLVLFGCTINLMLRNNINMALVEMNNPANLYGPYINWTTYGGGGNL